MNTVRTWILRIAAVLALIIGGSLLYDAYEDLTWGRRAIAEAGERAYASGSIQDRILSESAEKDKSGAASQNAGLLLIAAGLMMDGLASVISGLEKKA